MAGVSDSPKAKERLDSNAIVLSLLDALDKNPALTQRHVANELGIAVGLANVYIKRCIRKGLIKVAQAPARRYMYYLTPRGFAEKSHLTASYLSHSLSFFRRAREQCTELLKEVAASSEGSIVLLGNSDLTDIVRLISVEQGIHVHSVVESQPDAHALVKSAPLVQWYIVTALDQPQAVYSAAVEAFGADRVLAPGLLRLKRQASGSAAEGD